MYFNVFFITLLCSFKKFVLLYRFLNKLEEIGFCIKCKVTDQSHNNKVVTEGRYQISFEKVLQAFGLSTRCVTKQHSYTKLVTRSLLWQEAKKKQNYQLKSIKG